MFVGKVASYRGSTIRIEQCKNGDYVLEIDGKVVQTGTPDDPERIMNFAKYKVDQFGEKGEAV